MRRYFCLALISFAFIFSALSFAQDNVPENARASKYNFGAKWFCNRGYKRLNNQCDKILIPENAKLKTSGNEWECLIGFRKVGDGCSETIAPANATVSRFSFGPAWTCIRGYKRAGDVCEKVIIPENAKLNSGGRAWECLAGFRKSGQSCLMTIAPENASVNKYNFGPAWTCNRGFKRVSEQCQELAVPQNAKLDLSGKDWVCNVDFRKQVDECIKMSADEIAAKEKRKEELVQAYLRRRALRRARASCDVEGDTNSEVCITINESDLDCDESYSGNYYSSCTVELTYEVYTDYKGSGSIEAYVDCEVEVEYSGKNVYSDSEDENESNSHTLYREDATQNTLDFEFDFYDYQEVNKVEVDEASCRITDLSR